LKRVHVVLTQQRAEAQNKNLSAALDSSVVARQQHIHCLFQHLSDIAKKDAMACPLLNSGEPLGQHR
jgi:hypothetical protein